MKNEERMKEHLTKARDSMCFACGDLRAPLEHCSSVDAVALMALLKRANELHRDVETLLQAYEADYPDKA